DVLHVEKCCRKGRYSVRKLIEKYGRKGTRLEPFFRNAISRDKSVHEPIVRRPAHPRRLVGVLIIGRVTFERKSAEEHQHQRTGAVHPLSRSTFNRSRPPDLPRVAPGTRQIAQSSKRRPECLLHAKSAEERDRRSSHD